MAKILRFLLLFAILAALWCGLLWFGLPQEWTQGYLRSPSLLTLIVAHAGPPFFVATAWKLVQLVWGWRVNRASNTAVKKESRKKQTALETAQTAHQKELARLRARVDCRAIWAAVSEIPKWFGDGVAQCALIPQDTKEIHQAGREAALIPSLRSVFERALMECEAAPFLPVMLATSDPAHQGWTKQAWHEVMTARGIEHYPSQSFAVLPVPPVVADETKPSSSLPERLITLFEENPDLPAVILVGMDSPMADSPPPSMFLVDPEEARKPKPSHAVVALLLSRPGLSAPGGEIDSTVVPVRDADPYTPFWEREQHTKRTAALDTPGWGRVPLPLRPAFLQTCPPIATLHRTSTIPTPGPKRRILIEQLHQTSEKALIHAGLRDLPFEGNPPPPEAPESLLSGWLIHNVIPMRLGLVTNAFLAHGHELEPIKETSHIEDTHGDTGAARSVLMLAEALIRSVQLNLPVVVTEVSANESIHIGLVRPVLEEESAT